MKEETKNFSALVLKMNLMTEARVEECLSYQEGMSVHGLEKPIWVIALEKGYLPEARYKEVVQGVKWLGVRQEDRKFGEMVVKMGFVAREELDGALATQEALFSSQQKVRRLGDLLIERGVLTNSQRLEALDAVKLGKVPTVQARTLEDVSAAPAAGLAGVEEVGTLDELMAGVVGPDDPVLGPTIEEPEHLQPTIEEPESPPPPPAAPKPAPAPPKSSLPPAPSPKARKPAPAAPARVDQEAPTIVRNVAKLEEEKKAKTRKFQERDLRKVPEGEKAAAKKPAAEAVARETGSPVASEAPETGEQPAPDGTKDGGKEEEREKKESKDREARKSRRDKPGDAAKTRVMTQAEVKKGQTKTISTAEAAKGEKKKGIPVAMVAGAVGGVGCLAVVVVLLAVFVILPALSGSGKTSTSDSSSSAEPDGEPGTKDEAKGETPSSGGKTPGEAASPSGGSKKPPDGPKDPGPGAGSKPPTGPGSKPSANAEAAARKLTEAKQARSEGRYAEALEALKALASASGSMKEGKEALELVPAVEAEDRCDKALRAAREALAGGDLGKAQSSLDEARKEKVLPAAVEAFAGDLGKEKEYRTRVEEGGAHLEAGRFEEARAAFAKALEAADRPEAKQGLARARAEILCAEGIKAVGEGKAEEALRSLEEAKGLLEGESLPVPAKLSEALADCTRRAGEVSKRTTQARAEELLKQGKGAEAIEAIEAHSAKFGADPELDALLQRAKRLGSPSALEPLAQNAKGQQEFRNSKDGSVLILVPGGEFTMGSDKGDKDQQPVRKVTLSNYFLSRTEVTNEQFAAFLNDVGKDKDDTGQRMVAETPAGVKKAGGTWVPAKGFEKHPATGVSWFGARAYCRWAGGDLPTEAQWERAARGEAGSPYPWGAAAPSAKLAVYGPSVRSPEPVGSRPDGASPVGALDMAGNVWEWCRDAYDAEGYKRSPAPDPFLDGSASAKRVLRGGSFRFSERFLDPANRISHFPSVSNAFFGFRLAIEKTG